MFRTILIANRGEIACRIIRSARRMGIRSVAVYSEADQGALHVDMANEAICIGPPPSTESYLNIPAILDAIAESGAEAVHPGYGFLSENAEFAEMLAERGIVFVGPDPRAIRLMGDKIQAKKWASEVGVPTVPGHVEALEDPRVACEIARSIGYPVLLKASAGGGGKGIRRIGADEEMEAGLRACRAEALSSFGDGRVFLEKYITDPRHIEIQILADGAGNVVHLGERECSLQRRHQKVIEEAPSPFVTPELRAEMGARAVDLARAVDYVSAGTVEFIVGADRTFYFLEMNTRLQVEHPVTEEVTGLDLVEQMIRIAAGETLAFGQDDIRIEGWAMEARIYAEDPARGFLPAIGRVVRYREPVSGVFGAEKTVRVDGGVLEGDEVNRFYDPMIAKLITVGADRDEAIRRMRRSLDEYYLRGVKHNIGFLAAVFANRRFQAGALTTEFIGEEFGDRFDASETELDNLDPLIAAAAAMHRIACQRNAGVTGRTLDGRPLPRAKVDLPDEWVVILEGRHHPVRMAAPNGGMEIWLNGRPHTIDTDWTPGQPMFAATIGESEIRVQVDPTDFGHRLTHGGFEADVRVVSAQAAAMIERMPPKPPAEASKQVLSPMPGLLVAVHVAAGQEVKKGESLAIVEAMKMENQLLAEHDGVIKAVHLESGDSLVVGQVIMEFE